VVIGLTLIYLTIGYRFGGTLADRRPEEKLLYQIITWAGFITGFIPLLADPILRFPKGRSRASRWQLSRRAVWRADPLRPASDIDGDGQSVRDPASAQARSKTASRQLAARLDRSRRSRPSARSSARF